MIYHSYEQGCGCSSSQRSQRPAQYCCFPHCCCPHSMMPGMPPAQPPYLPQPRGLSVLTAASTGAITVAAGGTLPFELNTVSVGTDITHAAGTGIISINTPGVYLVSFNGTATPAATADLPSTIEVELRLNGTAVPGAAASTTFTDATDAESFAFTTAVNVTTVPATLSVVVPEGGAIFSDAALTVVKLGTVPLTVTPPLPAAVIPPMTTTPFGFY